MPNRLIHSTSPYLLQHANNPVDWFEWGNESLQKAKKEGKPILVSIGYSSCHWCHVMERESFENEDIAQLMNEHFICIKVDREERPDVDHIYMEAVQAMGVNGGWPLNVFLTPDQKPFYGGTYFPPRNWAALLININKAYNEKRNEILTSAEEIKNHLNINDVNRFATSTGELNVKETDKIFSVLQSRYDSVYGGLDKAPKFVMPSIWLLLLRYYNVTKNSAALNMVEHSLKMIASGGIFDQLAGGFARYSVDGQWFAPHFEKMLYDNGQLLSLYSEAYTVTKNPLFKDTIEKTINWVEEEMTHPHGGFYSALDADSEGTEGKFYVWTWDEFKEAAGPDVELAAAWFNVKENGNWEHGQNILTRPDSMDEFIAAHKVSKADVERIIAQVSSKLFEKRVHRIRPGLDDKILLGWNVMMVEGLADASLSLGINKPLVLAEKAMQFLEQNLMENGIAYRSYKEKHSVTTAFLEDHAFLIRAYIKLYQATLHESYLLKARDWAGKVIEDFYDITDGYFGFSSKSSEKLIATRKGIFDNVIPSGNSMMARNLLALANYFDKNDWHETAVAMISKLSDLTIKEPAYMANWGMAYLEASKGFDEIAISGDDCFHFRKSFANTFLPFALYAGSNSPSVLSVLQGREPKPGETLIYVCRDKTCKLPVKNVKEALLQIGSF